jgi:hypothetical protein
MKLTLLMWLQIELVARPCENGSECWCSTKGKGRATISFSRRPSAPLSLSVLYTVDHIYSFKVENYVQNSKTKKSWHQCEIFHLPSSSSSSSNLNHYESTSRQQLHEQHTS